MNALYNFGICHVPGTVLVTENTTVNKPKSLLLSLSYSMGLDFNYFSNYTELCV